MFIKKTVLFLSLLIFAVTGLCQAGQDNIVSGNIITGFRVLQVDSSMKEINLTVYRGDYIKFSFPESFTALDFSLPDLKHKGTIYPNPDKSPFFKMKITLPKSPNFFYQNFHVFSNE